MNFIETEGSKMNTEPDQTTINSDITGASFQNEISFWKAIENSIPSGIAVIDERGRQVYVNQSFCKMVGWNEEELLGKYPPYVYWPPREIEKINNILKETIGNNFPKEGFDLVFQHRNGREIPVNIIISPFVQQNNQTFYLANVIDITGRKKGEEALVKSRLLLMSSIESHKETIVFSIDGDYNYMYFNKAHRDSMKFAYNCEIESGKNMLECIPRGDERKLIKDNLDRALKGESCSLIHTFGNVNRAHYEIFFNPIRNEEDHIFGCTVFARNITDRIEAEQALKDSEKKFREIINQINDMIIVFDGQGKIIIWNRGAEMITGLKSQEVMGGNIIDIQLSLTPPPYNDRAVIEKAINGFLKHETPERFNQIIDSEFMIPGTGKSRNIQSMVFPIMLNGDSLFCTVVRDTTEIKRYEKELLRISAEKDKFYSMIAQYLYTPFNVFNNFSKLMAEELDNLPLKEIQKMAGMMSKSATNLYGLLDNLLQWTKMNQGKIPFEPQKLNLRKISLDAVSILKPHLDSKNIKINLLTEEEINISADSFMLKTILRNLISFAMNFTGKEGQIGIQATEAELKATVSVDFNGAGITSSNLSKLFDISQINSSAVAAEEKGTSLGLLLCKEFVDKHGGKIWAENGNGNRYEIKFTLPVYTPH
ncbi:MAG: PAS domain S-box protein [Deltaproteobacteria bacterium]|nr:MAG: PAS domain S-box protein [Deltaproteobacteria bacterium]